jgi:outer membrane immunogenic protein
LAAVGWGYVMLRKSALVIAGLLGLAASANAADIYRSEGVSLKDTPVYGPIWTGFYVGGHGGYAWADPDFPGAPAFPKGPPRPHLEGGFVGAELGYNFQVDRFVIGAVADISFANLNDTVRDGNYLTETTKIDRFGTVRGVVGYPMGRWLPYGTAGFAWANTSFDLTCPDPAAAFSGTCSHAGPRHTGDTQTMTGLAYGGGLKYAIDDHFSIGAEYLHLDFDSTTFSFGPFTNSPPHTGKLDATGDLAKFSVDYRIGWGYAPLK